MVANAEGTTPGAGWFADPAGSPYLRWWDGSQWTDNFIDAKTGAPPGELPAASSAAVQEQAAQDRAAELVAEPVQDAAATGSQSAADSAFAPGSPYSPIIPGAYEPEVPVAAVPPVVAPSVVDAAAAAVPPVVAPPVVVPPIASPLAESAAAQSTAPGAPDLAAAHDPGPSFPEQTFPEQTFPASGQLTRRQARIMQDMEEARAAAAAENAAASGEVPPSIVPPVAPPTAADFSQVPPSAPTPVADYTQAAPPTVPPVVFPPVPTPASPVAPTPSVSAPAVPTPAAPAPSSDLPAQTPIVPPPAPTPVAQPLPVSQDPIVVPVATPSTPFDASTVAPPTTTPATATPAAWPFASAPDPQPGTAVAGVAPAAAVAAASATPWMSAPPPAADGTLPVEKAPYEPMARQRSGNDAGQEVFVGGTSTWAVWVFAALPILHLAIIWYIYTTVQPTSDTPLIRWGVLLGPIVFYVLLAAVDLSILKRNGHVNLPSVLLAIIPVLYLAIRTTRLGVRSIAPLAVWIVLQAATVAALIFVFPTIYSQLTVASAPTSIVNSVAPVVPSATLTSTDRATQLTPAGMQTEITKELAAKGTTVTSVTCPPLASTADGSTVTCSAIADSGNLKVVVKVNSANQQAAFDIVSSDPA